MAPLSGRAIDGDPRASGSLDLIRHSAIAAYFAVRLASALVLLKLSAQFLTVQEFANFTQFLAFASLLNMAVVAGAQNGLIREAAAASDAELADVQGAGLAIWLAAVPLVGVPVALLSPQFSHVLTGTRQYWAVVIGIAALSLAAGPGQISWSLLSGRKRVAESLGAQALGILSGTAAAAWFIVHGSFVGAALGFAAGPFLATLTTVPLILSLPLRWRPTTRGLGRLLGFSAAIGSTLGFSSIVLFGLRWTYREQFGSTELGYWLAANRISDMSTQFLGLFMLQAFVPQLAMTTDRRKRRRLVLGYGLIGSTLTGAALLVFAVAGRHLVHLFLSDAYLPAIPSIRLYMVGDFCRVWVSVAMFTAFAAGEPRRYAAIEICTMAMMAVLALLLMHNGEVLAPQIAYVTAFAVTALALGTAMILYAAKRRLRPPAPRVERRIPLPGIAPRLP